jgi:hypothetical protein
VELNEKRTKETKKEGSAKYEWEQNEVKEAERENERE